MKELSRYAVVEEPEGIPPYALAGPDGSPIEPVTDYLLELLASDCSPATLKSYALDLLDWFRFLDRSGVLWYRAERAHVRDYVLLLRSARNPYRERKAGGAPLPGSLRGPMSAGEPLWIALRGSRRPLNYQALRAIMTCVNGKLGTNLVLHDLRHTCAMRLASDPEIPITDVQTHLRHKRLSSTEVYLVARPEEVIRLVQAHQRQKTAGEAGPAPSELRWAYDPADLAVLLGEQGEQEG